MSLSPVRVSFTVAPARKPVPARFVMLTALLLSPEFGVMLVTVGGDAPSLIFATKAS